MTSARRRPARPSGSISSESLSVVSERFSQKSAAASGSISSTMSAARSESSELEHRHLHLRIEFLQRLRRYFFVQRFEHRLALRRSQVFHNVGDVRRMQLRQPVSEIFSFTRRAGSVSIKSTNSHGITFSGIFPSFPQAPPGTTPFKSRRTAPRAPTSTAAIFNPLLMVCFHGRWRHRSPAPPSARARR